MMMRILAAAIFAAAISVTTYAQDKNGLISTITRENGSVLDVIKANKCQEGWRSQILLDSNIRPGNQYRLPRGTKIILHEHSCQDIPPLATREMTAILLQTPKVVTVSKLLASNTNDGLINQLRTDLDKAGKTIKGLQEKLDNKPSEDSPAPIILPVAPSRRSNLVWAVLLGFALGVGLCYFGYQRVSQRYAKFDKVKEVSYNGKKYQFSLNGHIPDATLANGYIGTYHCNLCPANQEHLVGREPVLVNHIKKEHSEDRGTTQE